MKTKIVCLLTDFGVTDAYVGVMKGILLSQIPSLQIVDLTHNVPPQNVKAAAFELMTSFSDFPRGTFFICVVDPGVGSERKILYAETGGHRFMAPDNGLLSWVFEKRSPTFVLTINSDSFLKKEISRTFHGRDIIAPLAGRLLLGEKPLKIGKPVKNWIKLPFPKVKKTGSKWEGEVLHVDGFGNLITNFSSKELQSFSQRFKLRFEGGPPNNPFSLRGLVNSYSETEKGKLLAIPGSAGFIEISVRDGSAGRTTGLSVGSSLTLYFHL